MSNEYIIGTRGSLLAVAQTNLIKDQLEEKTGHTFKIVTIKTQGDIIQDKPLWQLEGKDFFTKELDHALLSKDVDMVIHSYKDLGSERPEGIKLAAVTERKYANDILLMNESVLTDVPKKLIIGTSSPRRIHHVENEILNLLPKRFENCELEVISLRGNVNTRITKLKSGQYHGIILAHAGLERLALQKDSKDEIKSLLEGIEFMLMPQKLFPSSASQGALGIECLDNRDDNNELLNALRSIHHDKTSEEVKRERKSFNAYGGGCHLAVGIHVKKIKDQYIHIHRGEVGEDKEKIRKAYLEDQVNEKIETQKVFIGLPTEKLPYNDANILGDELIIKEKTSPNKEVGKHLFVTSRYCLDALGESKERRVIWASGKATQKQINNLDIWVHGSAEGFGHEQIESYLSSSVIELLKKDCKDDVQVLSSNDAESILGEVVGCYQRVAKEYSAEWKENILACKVFFWTSFPQYLAYKEEFSEHFSNPEVTHFCGLGKTYDEISKVESNVKVAIDMSDFYERVQEWKN